MLGHKYSCGCVVHITLSKYAGHQPLSHNPRSPVGASLFDAKSGVYEMLSTGVRKLSFIAVGLTH